MSDSQQVKETAEMIAKYPLPKPHVPFAVLIATWIDVTVPCVTSDEQSEAVTDMVVSYLRGSGVSDMVISEALSKSVYKYSSISLMKANLVMLVRMHDQHGVRGHDISFEMDKEGTAPPPDPGKDARDLDAQFAAAANVGNGPAMKKIAQLLLDMLNAYGRAKSGKERNEAAAAEILRNARRIRPLIRVIGPERPVPGPDGRTPRRVGPNTYVLDEKELEAAEAEAEWEGEGEAD